MNASVPVVMYTRVVSAKSWLRPRRSKLPDKLESKGKLGDIRQKQAYKFRDWKKLGAVLRGYFYIQRLSLFVPSTIIGEILVSYTVGWKGTYDAPNGS